MRATIFHAEIFCDPCGRRIADSLQSANRRRGRYAIADLDTGDSDDFPQIGQLVGASDSPDHCAAREGCENPIDLCEWGLDAGAQLVGAETSQIGDLVAEELTAEGVSYLLEMIGAEPSAEACEEWEACEGCADCTAEELTAERDATPYQSALYNFWRAAFADFL